MLAVATKKKSAKPSAEKSPGAKRTGASVFGYLQPEIRAAVNLCIKESDPRLTLTAILESALKKFLSERGYWPPARTSEP